jgi:2-amino-4-hydroxy-6-hydroxymethyldihydropteridine diphosphokinase
MEIIYLGLGSNIDAERNLGIAVAELRRRFDVTGQSSLYSSKPVGFEGDNFLNLVVQASTQGSPREVVQQLEEIHELVGRKRGGSRYAAREIDIDLLLYGQHRLDSDGLTIPRRDVLEYGFVLLPLCEVAPDLVHPVTHKTMADHQREFCSDHVVAKVSDIKL